MGWGLGLISAAAAILATVTAASGNTGSSQAAGHVLYENRCARCHGLGGDGGDGLGPPLVGVLGRSVAGRADFVYSHALRARGGVWTTENLDQYISDPDAFAPGTDMDARAPDPSERAAIVEYLRTLR